MGAGSQLGVGASGRHLGAVNDGGLALEGISRRPGFRGIVGINLTVSRWVEGGRRRKERSLVGGPSKVWGPSTEKAGRTEGSEVQFCMQRIWG